MPSLPQTLAPLPDQDSFYDLVDLLEEQGLQDVTRRYIGRKGTDLDLLEQLNIYEVDVLLPCLVLSCPPFALMKFVP